MPTEPQTASRDGADSKAPKLQWKRGTSGSPLEPRTVIHIDEAPLAECDQPAAITLQPLTGPDCDTTVLIFTFPPNYVGKVHGHPTDTVYVVRRGQFIVEGEGTFNVGDIRWVKANTLYGPEAAGPEGCEVMLIGHGKFPLPSFQPSDVGQ